MIDVGCMQINLHFHADAFASLDEAFEPTMNARYAARFLRRLYKDTGSWQDATMRYHSATPAFGIPYRDRVMAFWRAQKNDKPAAFDTVEKQPNQRFVIVPVDLERTRKVRLYRGNQVPTRSSQAATSLIGSRQPSLGDPTIRSAASQAAFASKRQKVIREWRRTAVARQMIVAPSKRE